MLDSLYEGSQALGAAELAALMGADRSTAFRLAQALVRVGWLRQDPATKKYRLAIRLWELGAMALANVEMPEAARPHLQRLAASTAESCNFAILDGADLVYIERVKGERGSHIHTRVGTRIPAHAVGMGKVLLASLSHAELSARLPIHLKTYTPRTITDHDELWLALEQIRVQGFAVNLGEWRPDEGGVAAPVVDRTGECVAAVGLELRVSSLTLHTISKMVPQLRATTAAISRDLGARDQRGVIGGARAHPSTQRPPRRLTWS